MLGIRIQPMFCFDLLYRQIIKTQDALSNDYKIPQGSYPLQSTLSSLNSRFAVISSLYFFFPLLSCLQLKVLEIKFSSKFFLFLFFSKGLGLF